MRVTFAVIGPDGKIEDRMPTEEELQDMAERYVVAVLQLALPGSEVKIIKKKDKGAAAAG